MRSAGDADNKIAEEDAQTILYYYVLNTLSGTSTTWDELLDKNKPPVTTTAITVST